MKQPKTTIQGVEYTLAEASAIREELIAIPSFLYYVDGFLQVGMRHALDFEPFLFLLMALALRDNARRWAYWLMVWSIAVGFCQVWYWWNFMPK